MLKQGSIIILTSTVYHDYDHESYEDVIVCRVTKDIENINILIDNFTDTRQTLTYCYGNCDSLPEGNLFNYCPWCGNKLHHKKQSSSLTSFIEWCEHLEREDNTIPLIEY